MMSPGWMPALAAAAVGGKFAHFTAVLPQAGPSVTGEMPEAARPGQPGGRPIRACPDRGAGLTAPARGEAIYSIRQNLWPLVRRECRSPGITAGPEIVR